MTEREQVLSYLAGRDWTSTLDISKHIHGPSATKKMVNPLLYAMMKEGLLIKQCNDNGGDPKWKLSAS